MRNTAPKIRNSGLGDAECARLEPGTSIRVHGRSGVWTVVRDTGGALVIIRSGREHTSTPRSNVRPARKPKREKTQ